MDKRGNLQNVGYPVFFTPGAIAKLWFICDGEVTISQYDITTFIPEEFRGSLPTIEEIEAEISSNESSL